MRLIPRTAYKRLIDQLMPRLEVFIAAFKPYVDGLDTLPADGRFLLVGNHTAGGNEAMFIPYLVRRQIGVRVRPLADRRMGNIKGPPADLMAAFGAVVGTPDAARQLMSGDEPILVFPGGGREINKGSDQLYELLWEGRTGFARLAAEHDYPIVPVALVGGDDVFHILTASDGIWARLTKPLSARLTGRTDMTMHMIRGIGPTLVPRPQRMYLRFGAPIPTSRPDGVDAESWATEVRAKVKSALSNDLDALQKLRAEDPYRQLAPWARSAAIMAESG